MTGFQFRDTDKDRAVQEDFSKQPSWSVPRGHVHKRSQQRPINWQFTGGTL